MAKEQHSNNNIALIIIATVVTEELEPQMWVEHSLHNHSKLKMCPLICIYRQVFTTNNTYAVKASKQALKKELDEREERRSKQLRQ